MNKRQMKRVDQIRSAITPVTVRTHAFLTDMGAELSAADKLKNLHAAYDSIDADMEKLDQIRDNLFSLIVELQ